MTKVGRIIYNFSNEGRSSSKVSENLTYKYKQETKNVYLSHFCRVISPFFNISFIHSYKLTKEHTRYSFAYQINTQTLFMTLSISFSCVFTSISLNVICDCNDSTCKNRSYSIFVTLIRSRIIISIQNWRRENCGIFIVIRWFLVYNNCASNDSCEIK